MSASNQWYYANSRNEHQGPVDAAALVKKLERGELTPKTLVWREGMAEWQPLSSVQAQLAANPPDIGVSVANAPDTEETGAAAAASPDQQASPYTAPSSTLSVDDGKVVSGEGEIVHAGFWRRVAANMIDGLIINVVVVVLMSILAPLFGFGMLGVLGIPEPGMGVEAMAAGMLAFQALIQLVALALTATYYVWLHSSLNMATLGKMAVGIKVVRLNGERISVARAIGRYFAFILSSMTMGIGFIMAGLTQRKQALHDMICDTLVVDKWAFTDRPDLQQKGLGPVTIAVLVLFGVLMVFAFFVLIAVIVAGLSQLDPGAWK